MSFSITSVGITTDNIVNSVNSALSITSGVRQVRALIGQTLVFNATSIPGSAGLTQLYIPDTITPLQIPSSTPIVGCVLSNASTVTPVAATTFCVGLYPSVIAPGITAGSLTTPQQISAGNITSTAVNNGISSYISSPNTDSSNGVVNTYAVLAITGATITGQTLVTLYALM